MIEYVKDIKILFKFVEGLQAEIASNKNLVCKSLVGLVELLEYEISPVDCGKECLYFYFRHPKTRVDTIVINSSHLESDVFENKYLDKLILGSGISNALLHGGMPRRFSLDVEFSPTTFHVLSALILVDIAYILDALDAIAGDGEMSTDKVAYSVSLHFGVPVEVAMIAVNACLIGR